jgi:hypothetical protein
MYSGTYLPLILILLFHNITHHQQCATTWNLEFIIVVKSIRTSPSLCHIRSLCLAATDKRWTLDIQSIHLYLTRLFSPDTGPICVGMPRLIWCKEYSCFKSSPTPGMQVVWIQFFEFTESQIFHPCASPMSMSFHPYGPITLSFGRINFEYVRHTG